MSESKRYVVLWVDGAELLRRDDLRIKDHQMGARCQELVEEFASEGIAERFFFDTTDLDVDEVVLNIMRNDKFIF